ncbi:MAG: M48 family metalloprotease [Candidatus Omnitrophota bacterium]
MSMKCSHCRDVDLVETLTQKGVLVDYCPKCQGIWLDKGEIYYFTEAPTYLRISLEKALKNAGPSQRFNPHTQKPLIELNLFDGNIIIDYCPETQGIWLDKEEIDKLPGTKGIKLKIEFDKGTTEATKEAVSVPLPNLSLVSGITLFSLYFLLGLVLITCVNFGLFDAGFALFIGVVIAVIQFLLSPFLMDLSLRFFYKVQWTPAQDLPEHLREFISKVVKDNNINFPRIGIIPDGSPNAFTYGHAPNNARIVVTAGLLDLLEPQETESVVAHEIGHAVHWDMLVMTIAYLVPLLLYYVYRTLIRVKSRGREDKSAPYRYAIALVSYILYIISEYIVLWFSRIREYFADRFAGQVTDNPNSLASALVKIGYGLAGQEKKKGERKEQLESIKALGIFDVNSARALAISSHSVSVSMGGEVDKDKLKGAMRWDLWNPWALYYELHCTHPLIAKRLLALSLQSESQGKQPYINFTDKKPESYWDEFLMDIFVKSLPFFAVVFGLIFFFLSNNLFYLKGGLLLLGFAYLFQVNFSYDFKFFPELNISSLLKKVKVSAVRPVSCAIEGRIIGRGIPGLIWSEDFVLQDETGIIFLDYRQPLGIWNFLFGLLRAGKYIGESVKITGWYRRAPMPYVEIKSIETKSGKSNCFVFNVKIFFAMFLIIIGILSFFIF